MRRFAKSTYSANAHEEPRLEATLAGFDLRSPRGAPPPVSRLESDTKKAGCLPALRLRTRENLVKARLAPRNVGRAPALR
jgi:hypothetical protein